MLVALLATLPFFGKLRRAPRAAPAASPILATSAEPIEPGKERAPGAQAEEGAPPPARPRGLPGSRVLLAEDNPINRSLALAHLRRLGCRITVAHDGLEALDAFRREPFDLVLMDCQMPEMDGYAATRAIRAEEPDGCRTPIIAVTANALPGDRELCLACGMDDFLAKPYKQNQLQALLEQWLERAGRGSVRNDGEPGAAGAGDGQPMLDRGVLAQLEAQMGDDGPELIREIVGIYLQNTPQLLEAMETALARDNPEDLTRAAHTLKSGSASLGALRLSEICKRIELAAKDAELDGLGAAIAGARTEYGTVASALRAHCAIQP